MDREAFFSTGIRSYHETSTELLVAEMLLQLGEATWGRSWPTGEERYELSFEQGVWHLRGCRSEGTPKSFVACLQYEINTGQMSFHIQHGGGASTTDSLSQPGIGSVLKTAYRYGPLNNQGR